MTERTTFDAIVVGMGPAGEAVAGDLAEAGLSVLGDDLFMDWAVSPRRLAEGGRLELRREPVDVAEAIARVAHDVEVRAAATGQVVAVEPPARAARVLADPDRVRQVLEQLGVL